MSQHASDHAINFNRCDTSIWKETAESLSDVKEVLQDPSRRRSSYKVERSLIGDSAAEILYFGQIVGGVQLRTPRAHVR